MGMWAPGRLAGGAGRATPMGRGSVGHTTGARESLGEGLRRGSEDPQGGAGAPTPQTRSKKTAPAGAQGGGEDAEGVEMGVRGLGQSACQSGRVSAQLGFEVLELTGWILLEQEETTARVLFTKGLIFPGLSRAGD